MIPLPFTGLDSDGNFSLGFSLNGPDCDPFLDLMENERRSPIKYHLGFYPDKDWWKNPDEAWVGAQVLADGFAELSPDNRFVPSCPPPCYGVVPDDEQIRVISRPRGNVVDVRHHDLYSDRMAAFFVRRAPCRIGRAVFQGKVWPEHVRLFPEQSRNVLATELLQSGNCATCGSPLLFWKGPDLGHRIEDLVVCRNEQGTGHLHAEHPLIVSVEVARELKRQIRGGYGLDPILDVESPLGRRIVNIESRLRVLSNSGPLAPDF